MLEDMHKEGFHVQEGLQFYRIARASLYELNDHFLSCFDLDYIDQELKEEGIELIEGAR